MKPEASPARPDPLAIATAWIELHLNAPLTMEKIAAQAGLSPYHFSRLFTARIGRSVMAHVRARRLALAAQRLTANPRLRLVELAFDCGFESQAAFTRAFKRHFGVAPGRFRRGFPTPSPQGPAHMNPVEQNQTPVVQLPQRVRLEAFTVAGFSQRFDEATKAGIPQLWAQLIPRLPFEGQAESWNTYGVVSSVDRAEGSFDYLAGAALKPGAPPPAGFRQKTIPAATYAVFRITLDGTLPHPQIKAAMAVIWGELIPAAKLQLTHGPDFELCGPDFSPTRPGAVIDFHVPVED